METIYNVNNTKANINQHVIFIENVVIGWRSGINEGFYLSHQVNNYHEYIEFCVKHVNYYLLRINMQNNIRILAIFICTTIWMETGMDYRHNKFMEWFVQVSSKQTRSLAIE